MACSFHLQNSKLGNELQSCSNLVIFPPITNLTALCGGLSMLMSLNCPEKPHLGHTLPPHPPSYPSDWGSIWGQVWTTPSLQACLYLTLVSSPVSCCSCLCCPYGLPPPKTWLAPCCVQGHRRTRGCLLCSGTGGWWSPGGWGHGWCRGCPWLPPALSGPSCCSVMLSLAAQPPSSWWDKDELEHNWRIAESNLCSREAVLPPSERVCGCGPAYWPFILAFPHVMWTTLH